MCASLTSLLYNVQSVTCIDTILKVLLLSLQLIHPLPEVILAPVHTTPRGMWQGLTEAKYRLVLLLVVPGVELEVLIFDVHELLLLLLEPLGVARSYRAHRLAGVSSLHGGRIPAVAV